MHSIILAIILLCLAIGCIGQACDSRQFVVRNSAGDDYLTINSPTEVKTCGGINICTEISAGKQTLALDNGSLSISNGNSVKLPTIDIPDNSATNEIQTLNLDPSGQLSISAGNSITLPDNSATNEIQTLNLDASGHLSISTGNSVVLPDNSATNEIQTLSVSNNQMSISNGNTVTLPSVWSYTKYITYTAGVSVTATTWVSVLTYELPLQFPSNFSTVQISLNIPYSGTGPCCKRARAQLTFDGVPLCDVTLNNPTATVWAPLYFHGVVQNVQAGTHLIQLRAFVEPGNNLLIPVFDPAQPENTAPAIFSTYTVIGYP